MKCGSNAEGAVDALTRFFAQRGRDLPWRRPDAGPWGVLVSEVMLQQTPVNRVLPVYQEWMRRWPTPRALAKAELGDVLRAWGSLGYPRRALRLHEAAVAIGARFGGEVPSSVDDLLTLPGIGQYTARAIAAFAFGQRVPVVDTNVRRVISRAVRGIDEHLPATAADRREVEGLLPPDPAAAAAVSAAVMELGALVCMVRSPDCEHCPLADWCVWRAAGYPAGPPRRRPAQPWHGTDRQVRGQIMAALRGAHEPMDESALLDSVPTADEPAREASYIQRRRCLVSLIADGLAVRGSDGRISLP